MSGPKHEIRKELAEYEGKRVWLRGTFHDKTKPRYNGEVCLITDVTMNGEAVCDHLWMKRTRKAVKMELQEGERIDFDCKVRKYFKRAQEVENFGVWCVQNIRRVREEE